MKLPPQIVQFILAGSLFVAGVANAQQAWEQIGLAGLVNDHGELLARDGSTLTDQGGRPLVPSCALGPNAPGDLGAFRFFIQYGSLPGKLLIFHDGGGACWETNTCASPFIAGGPGTYDPTISETRETLAQAGGVLDDTHPNNPFQGWTKVFIPYCTGDVGWGNNDAMYPGLDTVLKNNIPGSDGLIHHRGYANLRAALRWVEDHYGGQPPSHVMVAGVSAGAYASPGTVFPAVKRLFPRARTYVIADSGNGVVTDSFLAEARAHWALDRTLPDYLQRVLSQGANGLPVRFFGELTIRFPYTRFGQFQNAYDSIQIVVYNIMKYTPYPELWRDSGALAPSLVEWSVGARLATNLSAWASNYRFYTAAGTEHGILVNIPPAANAGFCSDDFYTEKSAGGLRFRDWVNDMVNRGGFLWATRYWRNATCFPHCIQAPQEGCLPVVQP